MGRRRVEKKVESLERREQRQVETLGANYADGDALAFALGEFLARLLRQLLALKRLRERRGQPFHVLEQHPFFVGFHGGILQHRPDVAQRP